jgi:flagellar assembly protein FliH
MSSSSSRTFTPLLPGPVAEDELVLRGEVATLALGTPELRSGEWTRFGPASVLGDDVTEAALSTMVEDARSAAQSQGYAVGWAQGRREAAAEAALAARSHEVQLAEERTRWAGRQQAALDALQRAAEGLARATEEAQAMVRSQAIDLARELTETMVGHELRSTPDNAADVVARVLAAGPTDRPFLVRLHPDVADSAAVAPLSEAGVRVVAEVGYSQADALVEVDGQVIDLRLRSALDRVREVLS